MWNNKSATTQCYGPYLIFRVLFYLHMTQYRVCYLLSILHGPKFCIQYNFGQFSFSSVFLCLSLITITRQTSHDSGILRQDYGIIRDLPIGLCGPYIAAVLIIQGNLLPRSLAQCLFPHHTIYQTIRWLKQSILHEWTFAMK